MRVEIALKISDSKNAGILKDVLPEIRLAAEEGYGGNLMELTPKQVCMLEDLGYFMKEEGGGFYMVNWEKPESFFIKLKTY